MQHIGLIFLCLAIGWAMQRSAAMPPRAHLALNQYVIYVALPALALYHIPKVALSTQLLFPIGVAWLGFALSWLFFGVLGRLLQWPRKLTGALILTGGLGNTSFVGFPVIEALYGKEGLQTAILVDQPGSFVVLTTLGVLVATAYSKAEWQPRQTLKKIFFFPPFIAFLLACLLNLLNRQVPEGGQWMLLQLGQTVTPVALVSVGLQLNWGKPSKHWNFLGLGLLFKLVLMPLFFYLFYVLLLGAKGLEIQVSVLESAMPPMITGTILATSYGLKPRLCSMMIGIGIPLSFLSLALWYMLLQSVG